jgi:hypothetical protein
MPGDCWPSFEGARKTVPLEEFDEGVPTLLRVFGAAVDGSAPTPFALGPEINGADFDLRGRGLGETDSEVRPTCGIVVRHGSSCHTGTERGSNRGTVVPRHFVPLSNISSS